MNTPHCTRLTDAITSHLFGHVDGRETGEAEADKSLYEPVFRRAKWHRIFQMLRSTVQVRCCIVVDVRAKLASFSPLKSP